MAENRSSPDQFQLRLPPGMRDKLKAEAEKNKRSMTAEIIARLEATFQNVPGHMTPEAFSFVMGANYVNATKVAEILHEALRRLDDLAVSAVRAEDIADADTPEKKE